MASIKLLTTLLVLACVVSTSLLCTILAVWSGDKALTDTKHSRDSSVNLAFNVGEEAVHNRTKEYANLVTATTTQYVVDLLDPIRRTTKAMLNEYYTYPWSVTGKYDFMNAHRPMQWSLFHEFTTRGMTGLGVILQNYAFIIMYEDDTTMNNPPDGYHFYGVDYNYGINASTPLQGGIGRGVTTEVEPYTGKSKGVPDLTYDNVIWNRSDCTFAWANNGTVPSTPCLSSINDPQSYFYPLGAYIPPGQVMWTAPVQGDYYIILACVGSVYDFTVQDTFLGINFAMVDLRMVSDFLRKLHISEGEKSRAYTTVKTSWMDPSAAGWMTGTSHGTTFYPYDPKIGVLVRRPPESDDYIIAQVGKLLTADHYQNISNSRDIYTVNVSAAPGAPAEEFFVMVSEINDGYGIEWYVTVVIDRESVLGAIDASYQKTQADIARSTSKVNDDLNKARTVLYIVIVVFGLGLIAVGVWLVVLINAPLLVLERDMAAVAMMRLEDVSQKELSSLSEVRSMQQSFRQMIKNLIEYRNYMPASVLMSDEERDEESASEQKETTNSIKSESASTMASKRRSLQQQMQMQMQSMELKKRTITVAAANIVGFLNTAKQQEMLEKYLSTALLCVKAHRGLPDGFEGDRLYISFNAAKACSGHKSQGCECALSMSKAFDGIKLTIGVATGETRCGNMGVEGMKKFTYVGSLAVWFRYVERVGRRHNAQVAVDSTLYEESKGKFLMRALEGVLFPKHYKGVRILWAILGTKAVTDEEWMYQLEQGEKQDDMFYYNSAYVEYVLGNNAQALELLDKSTAEAAEVHVTALRDAVRTGKHEPKEHIC